MISITKVFHFETAHAIHNYDGPCRNIHGHSYELQVTVACLNETGNDFLLGPGFAIDFKELKKPVAKLITDIFDHKLLLSKQYLASHPELVNQENLITWEVEPTAENILVYFSKQLKHSFPPNVKLSGLKIYETKDSFAEWS